MVESTVLVNSVLMELAGQVRELPPPAGYDAALFAREMEQLSAEIAWLVVRRNLRLMGKRVRNPAASTPPPANSASSAPRRSVR
jgi:hypothetical protein